MVFVLWSHRRGWEGEGGRGRGWEGEGGRGMGVGGRGSPGALKAAPRRGEPSPHSGAARATTFHPLLALQPPPSPLAPGAAPAPPRLPRRSPQAPRPASPQRRAPSVSAAFPQPRGAPPLLPPRRVSRRGKATDHPGIGSAGPAGLRQIYCDVKGLIDTIRMRASSNLSIALSSADFKA